MMIFKNVNIFFLPSCLRQHIENANLDCAEDNFPEVFHPRMINHLSHLALIKQGFFHLRPGLMNTWRVFGIC